jgi:hypothetical protein
MKKKNYQVVYQDNKEQWACLVIRASNLELALACGLKQLDKWLVSKPKLRITAIRELGT